MELETLSHQVHLPVEVDQQFGIHRLVKAIKGRLVAGVAGGFPWLRSRVPSLWANSYFVATLCGPRLSVIKRYVETQTAR